MTALENNHDSASRILLVDDDVELCELMREFLSRRGFTLESVHDGRQGLARALSNQHDLMLLDVMLPGIDGFEVLRLLRRQSMLPVIMLTARTGPSDRVTGLNAGADDYLPKPFAPEELVARIRAVWRRVTMSPRAAEVLESDGLRLVPGTREAYAGSVALPLTTIEFEILDLLMRARGRSVSRHEITAAVYRRPANSFDRAIDVHVSNLRKKLGSLGNRIKTIRGVGYLLAAETAASGNN